MTIDNVTHGKSNFWVLLIYFFTVTCQRIIIKGAKVSKTLMLTLRFVDATYRQLESVNWAIVNHASLKDYTTTTFRWSPLLVLDVEISESNKFTREALDGIFGRLRVVTFEREVSEKRVHCVAKFKYEYH